MTDQELIRALRCTSTPGGPLMDCEKCQYRVVEAVPEHLREQVGSDEWEGCDADKIGVDAADRLTAVLGELERVTWERDAAVECIQFIATYMELDSMKDIRKMIETWKADGRRRKREKDTHMQAVRVHEADWKSADYWQQPPGRAARRLYV